MPALRDGRQLLAVKAAHRSAISGIAHEVSQSGMTVFIEPAAAVECANKVAAAEAELNAEIRRLLFELSETLRPFWRDFDAALAIMTELDYTLAAAKWGAAQNGIFAEDASVPNTGGKTAAVKTVALFRSREKDAMSATA